MTIANSQEYIIKQFADRGCELLDTYKNKSTPLKFRCKCGKEAMITYGSFRNGSYCMDCGGKKKHTTEDIQKFAKEHGCKLLSEYVNAHSIISIQCNCGKIYKTRWNDFRSRKSCKNCGYKKTAESLKHDLEFVVDVFEKAGCRLINTVYNNNQELLNYECVCGRKAKISFANFQFGHRCSLCRVDNMSGDKHHNWEPDRELLALKRKIRARSHTHIKHLLKRTGKNKLQKSVSILGYTQKQLREHLMSHPNWPLVKDGAWHIDHIFPVKAFLDHGIQDLKIINCLENLRPLTSTENLKKSGKYDKIAFLEWIHARKTNR